MSRATVRSGAGSREHRHGVIVDGMAHSIDIAPRGVHEGTTWSAPPVLAGLAAAGPGVGRMHVDRLRSTGEAVAVRDVVLPLTVHPGQRH